MNHIEMVEGWLAWFAVKRFYTTVITALSVRDNGPSLCELGVPISAVAAGVLHEMVAKDDVDNFSHGITIVQSLYSCLKDKVDPALVLRISSAMKCKMMFDLLRGGSPKVMTTLKELFPREERRPMLCNIKSSTKSRVLRSEAHFRSFFLTLVANSAYRDEYMSCQYHREFGRKFDSKLRQLVDRFLQTVLLNFPESPVDKILREGSRSDFVDRLHSYNLAAVEILLDVMTERADLSEMDCVQILETLRPPSQTGLRHHGSSLRHHGSSLRHQQGSCLTDSEDWFESQAVGGAVSQADNFTWLKPACSSEPTTTADQEVLELSEPGNLNVTQIYNNTRKRQHSGSNDRTTRKRLRHVTSDLGVTSDPDRGSTGTDSQVKLKGSLTSLYRRGRLYRMKSKTKEARSSLNQSHDQSHDQTGSELVIGSANEIAREQSSTGSSPQGQTATKGGQATTQGGQVATQGGQTATQEGQAATQGGQAATQGGQAAKQGGQAAKQGGQTATQGGQTGGQVIYEVVTMAEAGQSVSSGDSQSESGDATDGFIVSNHGDLTSNHDNLTSNFDNTTANYNRVDFDGPGINCDSTGVNHSDTPCDHGKPCSSVRTVSGSTRRQTPGGDPACLLDGVRSPNIPDQVDIISSSSSSSSSQETTSDPANSQNSQDTSSYHTCVFTEEGRSQNTMICDSPDTAGDVLTSDPEMVSAESELSYISGSSVCDCDDSCVIPSSHSLDKFDAVCGLNPDHMKMQLPAIDRHLQHPNKKQCVIKLYHNKDLPGRGGVSDIKLYS